VVLDTSVVLNVLASGDAARLLKSLEYTFWVPSQVLREVTSEPNPSVGERNSLRSLLNLGLIRETRPDGDTLETYLSLVSAPPPNGLEDGESAAIAVAESLGSAVALDDRKARRIATARRPTHAPISSVELFKSLDGHASFNSGELSTLVFNALHHARMRVPHEHGQWVANLIGAELASRCASLPASYRRAPATESMSPARF
jgi:predicted nucleic acid-binding protein